MRKFDAILFDADGVLQRPPVDLGEQLAVAFGLPIDKADELILDLFRAEAETLTGALEIAASVEPVLDRWGAQSHAKAFDKLWHQIEVDQSILALVAELRSAGIYCGLASNQQRRRAEIMSRRLRYGAHFDGEFYSCHLGVRKPDPAYFEEIIRRTGLNPSRTLFIDDRIENLKGAAASGLAYMHFVSPDMLEGGKALRAKLTALGV